MRLRVQHVRVGMATAMEAAWGSTSSSRELLLVSLRDDTGLAGYGEAAPLAGYDGVSVGDVAAGLQDCAGVIESADGLQDRAALLAACAERTVIAQALAAIDLALWDLEGRRRGKPVWELLGAPGPRAVAVNATLTASDRAGAAREAAAAARDGFACVKVKVGIGDDAGRIAAVRAAAGREMAIRLDANGAWDVEQARAALAVLAPAGIECCEEPVHGLPEFDALAQDAPVALALDETAAQPGALDRRHGTAVCLKVARCGGISGVVSAARRARAAGYEVYLASTLDGPLGIAAALHAAAAIAPDRPSGLATLGLFSPAPELPTVVRGVAGPPGGAGLGDGLVEWYARAAR